MQRKSRVERVSAVAVLDDPVRRALYDHVAAADEPIGREAAAAALGLPRSTAAFHLDRLASVGLLVVEYRRLSGRTGPGAGRPSKLYRRTDVEIAVSVPERHYELAAELLAAAAAESSRTGRPVDEAVALAATETGREIGASTGSLWDALNSYGFQPRTGDDESWVLGNCPFHRLARQHTDLVCGANLDLLRGIAGGAGDHEHTMVLDPAPGRCCVRIVPRLAGVDG